MSPQDSGHEILPVGTQGKSNVLFCNYITKSGDKRRFSNYDGPTLRLGDDNA